MSEVDPRLVAALEAQLRRREGDRVGWKLGIGDRERIGDEIAVGHLTSATRLESGRAYAPAYGELLHADAEVAVEIGPDGEIVGYGAALELVDLRSPPDTPEDVIAANVFHRAVAFAPTRPALPPEGVEGRLVVNAEIVAAGPSASDLADKVRAAGRILVSVGERLEAGDLIITGSIVQVPVAPGDDVEADLGPLGRVRLRIAKS
jgi:2-keto-4-pentenoate hydratase